MKILIVGAMDSEIDYLKSILENVKEDEHCSFKFYLGNIKEKEIILVKSGIGRVMAGMLIGIAYNNYKFDINDERLDRINEFNDYISGLDNNYLKNIFYYNDKQYQSTL